MTEPKKYRVLIVDDDESHLHKIKMHLCDAFDANPNLFGGAKPTIDTDSDARNVESIIKSTGEFPYDIIIADVFMPLDPDKSPEPDPTGGVVRIYHAIKNAQLHETVFLVAMTNRRTEAQIELGEILADHNTHYEIPWLITQYPKPKTIPGPASFEQLLELDDWKYAIGKAIGCCKNRDWQMTFVRATLQEIVGNSTLLTKAKLDAERYADDLGHIVLLTGETGSGKELIAQSLHWHSQRCPPASKGKDKPENYHAEDCQRLNSETVESELFGHIKGAFTGAIDTAPGIFGKFKNGTIFLDEFGSDPVVAQKLDLLLRRVLTKPYTFRPKGATKDVPFNGMVILGSSKLETFLESKTTAPDFLSRVAGVPRINVPPLRERRDDIVLLAEFFLARTCGKMQIPTKKLSKDAKNLLIQYPWPGNVRELENIMNKSTSKLTRVIGLEELEELQSKIRHGSASTSTTQTITSDPTCEELVAFLNTAEGNISQAARLAYGVSDEASQNEKDKVRIRLRELMERCRRNDSQFDSRFPRSRSKGGRPRK